MKGDASLLGLDKQRSLLPSTFGAVFWPPRIWVRWPIFSVVPHLDVDYPYAMSLPFLIAGKLD